jgi:hypothetical protein
VISAYIIDCSSGAAITRNQSIIGSSAGMGFVLGPAIGAAALGWGPYVAVKLSLVFR